MEKPTDWLRLWEDLARIQSKAFSRKKEHQGKDCWKDKARTFDAMVKKKWEYLDPSRAFVISALQNNPGSTVLDIGAGTGVWALLLARYAASVTALEPSDAMAQVMREKIAAEKTVTINIIKGEWPSTPVERHDYVLAAHSMYGSADFRGFVGKMIETARKACFLVLRVPFTNAIMAKAAMHVWGQPFDSPNFQIAYNALLQMGIYPNVLMEAPEGWTPWVNDSIDEALAELKSRLDIFETVQYDDFLTILLKQNLKEENGRVVWPVGNQSALVHWEIR